jgi:hypothetical protein
MRKLLVSLLIMGGILPGQAPGLPVVYLTKGDRYPGCGQYK